MRSLFNTNLRHFWPTVTLGTPTTCLILWCIVYRPVASNGADVALYPSSKFLAPSPQLRPHHGHAIRPKKWVLSPIVRASHYSEILTMSLHDREVILEDGCHDSLSAAVDYISTSVASSMMLHRFDYDLFYYSFFIVIIVVIVLLAERTRERVMYKELFAVVKFVAFSQRSFHSCS